ncbi:cytochrome d ubiquinol oxidase subunit II [Streptomyces sp. TRM76323]|uniref:Cytochrome d ubiquinol oxidase subunit II n=1 Tax=Streptomyces tamarix TaxID=3078565 RepID=A0ABU3QTA4_9ACTN|nr:cytochrome d ubiquinol oxidase subunit II [Streptomyces tamarix]MDT9685768.1 cytochrome d ubiquinol oxidase subunit II [Streptomyces tamarix]
METLAIALLGFYAAGYFVLAGADVGTGMVAPYLGRTDRERRLVIASFAPFLLGNEVWLVATAGLLVGCFPVLEGELLSGQFAVIVPLLVGWVVRDSGLWLRGRVTGRAGRAWRAGCDGAVVCGSWTVALAWGWLLAGVLGGTPERPASGAVALVTAAAVAALFAAHGLGFAAVRLTGLPYERARRLVGRTRAVHSFALTAVLMAAVPVAAGVALPLARSAADHATLVLLVPALLVVTPPLVAVQVWSWYVFRHRVTGPSYL